MSEWRTIEIPSKGTAYKLSSQGQLLSDSRPPRHKRRSFNNFGCIQFYSIFHHLLSSQSHKDTTCATDTNLKLECKENSQNGSLTTNDSQLKIEQNLDSQEDSITTNDSQLNLEQNLDSQEDSIFPTDNNINLNGDQNFQEALDAEFEPYFSKNFSLSSSDKSIFSFSDDIFL